MPPSRRLILVPSPRYADRAQWVEDLAAIAREVAASPAEHPPVAALAPAAGWAAKRGDVEALRRVARALAEDGDHWAALRPLALRARAALAAEPPQMLASR